MWNHSGQAAGFAHIMGVNVVHKVDSKVTNPILFPQEIRRIVATKSEAFTIVRQSNVWSHSEPLWLQNTSYRYFLDFVQGSNVGLQFSSTPERYKMHIFVLDFENVSPLFMRLCHPLGSNTVLLPSRTARQRGLVHTHYQQEAGQPPIDRFDTAVRAIPFTNDVGVQVPGQALSCKQYPVEKFNKIRLLDLVKVAASKLLSDPFNPHSIAKPYMRNDRPTVMEVKPVGHRQMSEIPTTKAEWFNDSSPPIDYPTASLAEEERSYELAYGFMENMIHKHVSTLLRLINITCPSIAAITLVVTHHVAKQARAVAHLVVGYEDFGHSDNVGIVGGIKLLCDLGIPSESWKLKWVGEAGMFSPQTPGEVLGFDVLVHLHSALVRLLITVRAMIVVRRRAVGDEPTGSPRGRQERQLSNFAHISTPFITLSLLLLIATKS